MARLRKSLLAIAALLIVPGAALHAQPAKAPPKPQPKAHTAPPPGAKAEAAQPSGPPNALQGFSQNRDEPVHIEAATLEVHDKQKEATFSGDVHVTQGDTDMRCKKLVVFYEQQGEGADTINTSSTNSTSSTSSTSKTGNTGKKSATVPAAAAGPGGQQHIKRLEAYGNVVVTQKDQTATGEVGTYDLKTSTVTLTGNVLMTQGKNVLRGERLWVDLATGVSRVEPGKNGHGRVEGLFLPNSAPASTAPPGMPGSAPAAPGSAPAAAKPAKPAAKPAETARSSRPMPLQPIH